MTSDLDRRLHMASGINKKRTIIMIATLGILGAVVVSLWTTDTASFIVNRPPTKAPTAIADPFIPNTGTDADKLSAKGATHQTVLRITTDMRSDGYDVVIDGWTKDHKLAEVRMWWLNPGKANQRSPFGKGVTRYVDLSYDRKTQDCWQIQMKAGKKQFEFLVERDEAGKVAAYADVQTSAGLIEHCKVSQSTLKAKKIFGLPTGLDSLAATCTDAEGTTHTGTLRTEKIRR